jgi:hypothetical protein
MPRRVSALKWLRIPLHLKPGRPSSTEYSSPVWSLHQLGLPCSPSWPTRWLAAVIFLTRKLNAMLLPHTVVYNLPSLGSVVADRLGRALIGRRVSRPMISSQLSSTLVKHLASSLA